MPDKKIKIGERIKSLRMAKGMSIGDVSKKSGISESIISSIEDYMFSPPLGNIISLAKVFEVSVGDFFGDRGDSPLCIVRSDDRKKVSRFDSTNGRSSGYSYESLGQQKKNRHMEPFLVTLAPTEVSLVEPNQHIGEEFIFVLEGKVEVRILEHTDVLNPGDSIYYDSTMPHIVTCHGNEPATILAVIYAKEEMIIF
jgi:transcriptional regulator with XRE-family HTH domain